jgi:hypothetical protein
MGLSQISDAFNYAFCCLDFLPDFGHCGSAIVMLTCVHFWSDVRFALVASICSLGIHSDSVPHPTGRIASLPRYTLWTWERREDLRFLSTRNFAVAYLDKTLTIGLTVASQPRRDLVSFPATIARMPVVRIEAPHTAVLNSSNRIDVVDALLASAREPGIAALQLDFDATRSQRSFYRDLLFDLRRQLPPNLPLSITALASWCSYDDWLSNLPIDEAVPMLFRMEADHNRAPSNVDDFQIREPLCQSSAGVSTTEPWPSRLAGKRVYVFADNGWRQDSAAVLERKLP